MSSDEILFRLEKMRRDLDSVKSRFDDAHSKRRDAEIKKMSDAEIDLECFTDDAKRLGIEPPTALDVVQGYRRIKKAIRDAGERG